MVNQQRIAAGLLIVLAFQFVAQPAAADTFGSGANTFHIKFVTIGNPGNAADITGNPNPAGSVAYTYRIAKYEITAQTIDKVNALAGLDITNLDIDPNWPAVVVSWNMAARFVNWLNTSSGSPPAYKFAIQPEEVGYNSSDDIQLWSPGDAGYDPNNLYRNTQAKYFLPSVDEWYKAAYYDPASGDYYDYPTGSASAPDGIDFDGDPNFDAVFVDGPVAIPPYDVTNVGLLSPYGTAGQGGNAWEWEETDFDLVNDSPSSDRGVRGGYWKSDSPVSLSSSNRLSREPSIFLGFNGIRVASVVPEPSTLLLTWLTGLAPLTRSRKTR